MTIEYRGLDILIEAIEGLKGRECYIIGFPNGTVRHRYSTYNEAVTYARKFVDDCLSAEA